jgi:drug/metabolite transporter (DMT)-like permease
MLPAFLTTILFSLSALFAQRTARALGGITANFWRMMLATLFLGLWSHLFGVGFQGPALPWLFVSGILGFGIGDVAMLQALPRIGSRLCILLVHCLATPTAAVTEYFWLGSTLSATQILCIVISLLGVAFAVAPTPGSTPRSSGYGLGIFFGLLAMLGQSFGAVLSRKASQVASLAGHPLNGIDAAYQRAWGGVLISLGVFVIYQMQRRRTASTPELPASETNSAMSPSKAPPTPGRIRLWVLANTLAGPVIGVSCYQWALANERTGVVLPIVALTPLVIIPFAHWLEGERTTAREVIGGIIAVGGVAALTRITHGGSPG